VALRPHVQADVDWLVADALREGELDQVGKRIGGRSAPADERALRGVPMIGGSFGHIPGTRPDRNRRFDYWSGRRWGPVVGQSYTESGGSERS
jgi:hypothetical protein